MRAASAQLKMMFGFDCSRSHSWHTPGAHRLDRGCEDREKRHCLKDCGNQIGNSQQTGANWLRKAGNLLDWFGERWERSPGKAGSSGVSALLGHSSTTSRTTKRWIPPSGSPCNGVRAPTQTRVRSDDTDDRPLRCKFTSKLDEVTFAAARPSR
jgi:hypothetical protein